jgi:N-acetylmuramoyl-L-alanine amidase
MRWINRDPTLPPIALCFCCTLVGAMVFVFLPATPAASYFLTAHAATQDQSTQPSPAPVAPPGASQPEQTSDEKQKRAQPEFVVLIDASHGGEDRGVVFAPKFYEKDVTLALARDLRRELQDRGIPARMVREGDAGLSLERRAEASNEQHGGIYVALHAGLPGKGVRVYAPLLASMPASSPAPALGKARFLPWETAQASSLDRSTALARAVTRELQKKNLDVTTLRVPLRPLNNIVGPAIAVELAPERGELRSLESQRRHNAVASAIASGIAQMRGQMGARP